MISCCIIHIQCVFLWIYYLILRVSTYLFVIFRAFTEIKQLLTYPPEGRGRISINTEDYVCLAQDQFLNDVIIDFYLKYLVEQLPSEQKAKVHVFSTFFYKRLTTKPVKASRWVFKLYSKLYFIWIFFIKFFSIKRRQFFWQPFLWRNIYTSFPMLPNSLWSKMLPTVFIWLYD